jgi:hypothetical protein
LQAFAAVVARAAIIPSATALVAASTAAIALTVATRTAITAAAIGALTFGALTLAIAPRVTANIVRARPIGAIRTRSALRGLTAVAARGAITTLTAIVGAALDAIVAWTATFAAVSSSRPISLAGTAFAVDTLGAIAGRCAFDATVGLRCAVASTAWIVRATAAAIVATAGTALVVASTASAPTTLVHSATRLAAGLRTCGSCVRSLGRYLVRRRIGACALCITRGRRRYAFAILSSLATRFAVRARLTFAARSLGTGLPFGTRLSVGRRLRALDALTFRAGRTFTTAPPPTATPLATLATGCASRITCGVGSTVVRAVVRSIVGSIRSV